MMCFIHVEKTAGTTLDYIFIDNFTFYFGLESWGNWSNKKGTFFLEKEFKILVTLFPFIKGIGGHSLRSWMGYENHCKRLQYITFLRNPIYRYLSHFRYQKHKMGIRWEINSFLEDKRFDNYMTFRFSESGSLDEAKENLLKLDFVGLQDDFDLSLLLMQHYLGNLNLSVNYEPKNINTTSKDGVDELLNNKAVKDKIIANNKNDIILYQFAKDEIFQRFKDSYPLDIDAKLEEFRKYNSEYVLSRRKQIFQKLAKITLIRPYEILSNKIYH